MLNRNIFLYEIRNGNAFSYEMRLRKYFHAKCVINFYFPDMSTNHIKKSALALVDGSILWDMHRPLINSCSLEVSIF